MCRSQRMRLSLEREDLNTAGRRAFPPSRPGEPAGFSAPGCLVYFYKRCLSPKCQLSCNFGSSIRLRVCLLFSWGGKRLWLLTASADRGRAARTVSPLTDTVTLMKHASCLMWWGRCLCVLAPQKRRRTAGWYGFIWICALKAAIQQISSTITSSCLLSYDTWSMSHLRSSRTISFDNYRDCTPGLTISQNIIK